MEDFVNIFNPANSKSLTADQKAAIGSLTTDQIKELAKAYPNTPNGNAYLVLHDNRLPADKQLNSLSTWGNLHDLHKIGQTWYSAAGFKDSFQKPQPVKTAAPQDLTKEQAQSELRNVTTASTQNASFAKDTNDSLVNKEGQGEQGAVTKPLQGGDIAGESHFLSEEEKAKITSGQNSVEALKGNTGDSGEEFNDEIPLADLKKPGLQEKYEEAFGAKPKEAWTKEQLIDAIEQAKPIE